MAGNLVTALLNPTQTRQDLPGAASANYQHTTQCFIENGIQTGDFFCSIGLDFFLHIDSRPWLWVRFPTVAPGTVLNPLQNVNIQAFELV